MTPIRTVRSILPNVRGDAVVTIVDEHLRIVRFVVRRGYSTLEMARGLAEVICDTRRPGAPPRS